MSENVAPYRSHQSVPTRVDAAWNRGYEAGIADARRLFGLVFVVWAFGALRRKGISVLGVVAIVAVLAVYLVPAVMAAAAIRAALEHHRKIRRAEVPRLHLVTLDDGTTF